MPAWVKLALMNGSAAFRLPGSRISPALLLSTRMLVALPPATVNAPPGLLPPVTASSRRKGVAWKSYVRVTHTVSKRKVCQLNTEVGTCTDRLPRPTLALSMSKKARTLPLPACGRLAEKPVNQALLAFTPTKRVAVSAARVTVYGLPAAVICAASCCASSVSVGSASAVTLYSTPLSVIFRISPALGPWAASSTTVAVV